MTITFAGSFLLFISTVITKECFFTLSTQNFTEVVDRSPKSWLIMFIDDNCGYCKDIIPIWRNVSEKLCNEENLSFGVVELGSNSDLRYRFEINYLLAFKLLRNGNIYTFDTTYPVQNLIDFSKRASAVSAGEKIPSYKSSIGKVWYIVKSIIKDLLLICECQYTKNLPDWVKVVLIIFLLFSPVVLAAILLWYLGSKTITGEEEEEINHKTLSAMRKEADIIRKYA